jgi:hypothetical protein
MTVSPTATSAAFDVVGVAALAELLALGAAVGGVNRPA